MNLKILDSLDTDCEISRDPILFPKRFSNRKDIEIVAFIAALFAYGNVTSILSNLEIIFLHLGDSPSDFLLNGNLHGIKDKLPIYRFQTQEDIYIFLMTIQSVWKQNQTFELHFNSKNNDIQEKIINFQSVLIATANKLSMRKELSYGLKFLIGSAKLNSPNKRYYMYLRWMVRNNFPDFGIYKSILPSELRFPLDTHIIKFGKILGLTTRKTPDIKTSISITEKIKEINKKDPLKYDFVLARLGIIKKCKGKYIKELCENCNLKKLCSIYSLKHSRSGTI